MADLVGFVNEPASASCRCMFGGVQHIRSIKCALRVFRSPSDMGGVSSSGAQRCLTAFLK